MRDNKFNYDEINRSKEDEKENNLEKVKNYFNNELLELKKPILRGSGLLDMALQQYILEEPFDSIRETITYAIKVTNLGEEELVNDKQYNGAKFLDTYEYQRFLRTISIAYLLGDFNKEDVEKYAKLIHMVQEKDILIDTILNAMIGTPVGDDVMLTNRYPKLVEIIKEDNRIKAEDMMEEFLKKEWWKNSGKYTWRDEKRASRYTGAFAFETAAIVKIKGLNIEKFKELQYFPYDIMTLNDSGINKNEYIEKKINLEGNEYIFKTNIKKGKDFEQAELICKDFSNLTLNGLNFQGADLSSSIFKNTKILNCNFSGANMFGVNIQDSELNNNNFDGIEAEEISIHKSELSNNEFNNSMLMNCGMTLSILKNNRFINSNLNGDSIVGSEIVDNIFKNTRLINLEKSVDMEISFRGNDFINVELDDSVLNEKEKSINTIL